MTVKPQNSAAGLVLVSACLAGRACRYNATAAPHPAVLALVGQGRAVLVCPEALGGLPVPREPMELRKGRAIGASGADHTEAFLAGARRALGICRKHGCARAILKSRSPSCGCGQVYDGSFSGRLVPGNGLFAALLKENGVAVCSEQELPGQ
ncbi:MAG TPA: DUF523 domain-containing protein [Humidesulfovibrio sp.]|uniref:DUF523 domain-containing protein n=1 Tax=Humidesulfovibrio sp. TaxID=2910988 RepID=UPI002D1C9D16|nr:DUF523 domain-containing protein [Humidesulfovibrio sp.]HWR02996.1 DUF523 domain-containing protein [Humidesulfovibrio sp.]